MRCIRSCILCDLQNYTSPTAFLLDFWRFFVYLSHEIIKNFVDVDFHLCRGFEKCAAEKIEITVLDRVNMLRK